MPHLVKFDKNKTRRGRAYVFH